METGSKMNYMYIRIYNESIMYTMELCESKT